MTEHPLIAFLRARYDDEESHARRAIDGEANRFVEADQDIEPLLFNRAGEFDLPERVLADIAAKRKILDAWADPFSNWTADQAEAARAMKAHVLRLLAEPFASHPDYPKDQPR